MDECKKAFEDWASNEGVYVFFSTDNPDECIGSHDKTDPIGAQELWSAWKTAWNHPNRNKHSVGCPPNCIEGFGGKVYSSQNPND